MSIHIENAVHRDLHSGNILYLQDNDYWYISDLGFCGPVDKPVRRFYGNLRYIAPEVINEKEYTKASDIYKISSGRSPFNIHENYYQLAMDILYGKRPKIIPDTLREKIGEICKSYIQHLPTKFEKDETNKLYVAPINNEFFTSKVFDFDDFSKLRNSEGQEGIS
ncbi:2453_t:CDS:2 [Funneliformis geosporum]|nr:2453_t:CDS:2 [Funneliformis geosporum]